MKTIFFTLFVGCGIGYLPAQLPALQMFPDPSREAQVPNASITYYISPWSPVCHVLDTVVGGTIINQQVYDNQLRVVIAWASSSDSTAGRITVLRMDSSCTAVAPGRSWEVEILPFITVTPIISGPDHYYVNEFNFLNFEVHPDSSLFIDSTQEIEFQWEAPADWNIYASWPRGASADVFIPAESAQTEGCIRVQARYINSYWGEWKDLCLQATIRPPCPLSFAKDFQVCGDTAAQYVYATDFFSGSFPLYPWSDIQYHWMVPPGWKIVGDNPSLGPNTMFQTDGHTNGSISIFTTANDFTSAICEQAINFLPASPETSVTGPDFVCQAGNFRLSPSPPAQSEVTWQIRPLNPAIPPLVSPDHGNGVAFFQVIDTTQSGDFQISYTTTNLCGTVRHRKNFFVGKPLFANTTLDGAVYTAAPICAGPHGVATQMSGARKSDLVWSASPGVAGSPQRDSFVFSLAPAGAGDCPVVTASVANACGTSLLPLEMCPQGVCDTLPFDLLVYPNPAFLIVSLKITSPDPATEDYTLIDRVEIFNAIGQLVTIWQDPPVKHLIKPVVDLPNGLYTLRATVRGQTMLKRLMVSHLF